MWIRGGQDSLYLGGLPGAGRAARELRLHEESWGVGRGGRGRWTD